MSAIIDDGKWWGWIHDSPTDIHLQGHWNPDGTFHADDGIDYQIDPNTKAVTPVAPAGRKP